MRRRPIAQSAVRKASARCAGIAHTIPRSSLCFSPACRRSSARVLEGAFMRRIPRPAVRLVKPPHLAATARP
jgi:hypothetical protein